jgi:hypothetical protein
MLNGGTLDGSSIQVASDQVLPDEPDSDAAGLEQSDKPRAAIAAEYLAKGYLLSDQILQRAIDIDKERGLSQKWVDFWSNLDKTLGEKLGGPEPHLASAKVSAAVGGAWAGARERASSIDEERGISKQAGEYYNKAVTSDYYTKAGAVTSDYYVKAVSSPFAQRVVEFYTSTTKQVAEVHEEARRIAAEQKATTAAPAS